jgi:hypothetical protein
MNIRVYLDYNNNKYTFVKATRFDELEENFKNFENVLDVNFYSFLNKKIGSQILNDKDLADCKGYVYATDLEYRTPVEGVYGSEVIKDSRSGKFSREDGKLKNDGKPRNKLAKMKIQKAKLEKTLQELQNFREKSVKAEQKEAKNYKRYTGKEKKSEGHEILDENVKEILLVENQLHKFAMDKLRRNQRKYLMKTDRSTIVFV